MDPLASRQQPQASPRLADAHQAIEVLQRLSAVFQRRRQQLAEAVGLSEQQWAVLEEVSTEHFMPSMFAKQRESTPAAVSKILRQLVDKQLVRVSVGKSDGRQRDYLLTAKGSRLIERLRESRRHAVEQVWLHLDADVVADFSRAGRLLAERLEDYSNRAGPNL